MTDASAERRRARAKKVAALAAAAGTPGEQQAAEAAAARLAGKVVPYSAPTLESEVLAALCNLGYELVPSEERPRGRAAIENDDGFRGLVEYLRARLPAMSKLPDPADWLRRLVAGRLILEPSRHPGGASSERAFTHVTALSAGTHTAPRNTK